MPARHLFYFLFPAVIAHLCILSFGWTPSCLLYSDPSSSLPLRSLCARMNTVIASKLPHDESYQNC